MEESIAKIVIDIVRLSCFILSLLMTSDLCIAVLGD
jgi:hypothetical protein